MNSTKTSPPNALLLVVDPAGGSIPESMRGASIASTESCVAVGCRSDADGDTEIVLGSSREVNPGGAPAFTGRMATPSHQLQVQTVEGAALLMLPVEGTDTLVQIWTNDPREPDKVIIGAD